MARPARRRCSGNCCRCFGLTVGFLDLIVEDLDASTAEIEGLGGRWLEPGETRELEGFRWRQMADPDGNEFDIHVLPGE